MVQAKRYSKGFLKKTKAVYLATDFVVRLERKNDSHTISNKTFDFSKTTIRLLIQDGYKETKEQMKEVLARAKREMAGT
jgi:NTE family protein